MSLSTEKRMKIGSITGRYGFFYSCYNDKNCIIIRGKKLPFDYLESIEGRIAEKCAQEFNLELELYDFSRGGDDWDFRFIFVVKCSIGDKEIKAACKRIGSAENKFSETCNRVVQIAFNSLST